METDPAQSRAELRQAERLFAEQRYADLVKHLAPQIFLFRSDARYYYLLGLASLYIGDQSGAHSYLLRGKDLDPLNLDLQIALAITHLGRKEEPQALQILVGIQDRHPTNTRAVQILDLLKQASEKVDWPEQIRLGKLRHLYPRPGFNWRPWLKRGGYALGGLGLLALLGLLVYGITTLVTSWQPPSRPESIEPASAVQPSPSTTAVDDRRFGVLPDAKPRFQLSSKEIDSLSREVTTAFREYRDNKARVLVNRLMQSNASLNIKERMRGLANHFKDPGFVNFRDNYPIEAILEDSLLHAGVFVMWRGKLADVVKGQTAITFNLLVGYESSPVVKATVPVSLDFAADVNAGEAIELIGQVLPDFAAGGFTLRGIALRLIRG
jgi:hypothetical protein